MHDFSVHVLWQIAPQNQFLLLKLLPCNMPPSMMAPKPKIQAKAMPERPGWEVYGVNRPPPPVFLVQDPLFQAAFLFGLNFIEFQKNAVLVL